MRAPHPGRGEPGGTDWRGRQPHQKCVVHPIQDLRPRGVDVRLGRPVDGAQHVVRLQHLQDVDERRSLRPVDRVERRQCPVGRRRLDDAVGEHADGRHRHGQQLGCGDAEQDVPPAVERGSAGPRPACRAGAVGARANLGEAGIPAARLHDQAPATRVVEPAGQWVSTASHQFETGRVGRLGEQRTGQEETNGAADLLRSAEASWLASVLIPPPPVPRRRGLPGRRSLHPRP